MTEPDFKTMTKEKLLELAARKKVPASARLLKKDLVALLKKALKAEGAAAGGKTRTARTAKKKAAGKPSKTAKPTRVKKGEKKSVKKTASSPAKKSTAAIKTSAGRKTTGKPAKKAGAAAAKATARKKAGPKTSSKRRAKAAPRRAKARTGKESPPVGHDLHPPFELEDMAQEAKFLVGAPTLLDESRHEATPELPEAYGEDRLVMLPRDPHWAHIYWELNPAAIEGGFRDLAAGRESARAILRVHSNDGEGPRAFDVDIDFRTRRHNLHLQRPGATVHAEIGLLGPGGRFVPLVLSNTVTMPVDGPSDLVDEEWMTTDEEFNKFYQLSAGPDATARQRRGGQSGGSFGVGSFSTPRAAKSSGEVSPWMRAEVILYGATTPGGRVTLGDEPIEVRSDGTFSIRLALPEGRHAMPITFHSPSGRVVNRIIPEISRKNRRVTGEVSS